MLNGIKKRILRSLYKRRFSLFSSTVFPCKNGFMANKNEYIYKKKPHGGYNIFPNWSVWVLLKIRNLPFTKCQFTLVSGKVIAKKSGYFFVVLPTFLG
jgi:hypothetical protein